MNLARSLRQTSAAAAQSQQARTRANAVDNARQRIERDLHQAVTLIRDLPPLLQRAAQGGATGLKVMQLERNIHFHGEDITAAAREFELHRPNQQNLLNGAWKVAEWLIGQGLEVSVIAEPHDDEGQGRHWTTLELTATW